MTTDPNTASILPPIESRDGSALLVAGLPALEVREVLTVDRIAQINVQVTDPISGVKGIATGVHVDQIGQIRVPGRRPDNHRHRIRRLVRRVAPDPHRRGHRLHRAVPEGSKCAMTAFEETGCWLPSKELVDELLKGDAQRDQRIHAAMVSAGFSRVRPEHTTMREKIHAMKDGDQLEVDPAKEGEALVCAELVAKRRANIDDALATYEREYEAQRQCRRTLDAVDQAIRQHEDRIDTFGRVWPWQLTRRAELQALRDRLGILLAARSTHWNANFEAINRTSRAAAKFTTLVAAERIAPW